MCLRHCLGIEGEGRGDKGRRDGEGFATEDTESTEVEGEERKILCGTSLEATPKGVVKCEKSLTTKNTKGTNENKF